MLYVHLNLNHITTAVSMAEIVLFFTSAKCDIFLHAKKGMKKWNKPVNPSNSELQSLNGLSGFTTASTKAEMVAFRLSEKADNFF